MCPGGWEAGQPPQQGRGCPGPPAPKLFLGQGGSRRVSSSDLGAAPGLGGALGQGGRGSSLNHGAWTPPFPCTGGIPLGRCSPALGQPGAPREEPPAWSYGSIPGVLPRGDPPGAPLAAPPALSGEDPSPASALAPGRPCQRSGCCWASPSCWASPGCSLRSAPHRGAGGASRSWGLCWGRGLCRLRAPAACAASGPAEHPARLSPLPSSGGRKVGAEGDGV